VKVHNLRMDNWKGISEGYSVRGRFDGPGTLGARFKRWKALYLAAMAGVKGVIGRCRALDVNLLVNRALVYGLLAAIIVGVYVVIVRYAGVASDEEIGELTIALLVPMVIVFLAQPVRHRLQHGVNQLMYGERDDPYAVLSDLSQRLEAALAPESVLPTIVETVAQALKLPYVAITIRQGNEFALAAAHGSPAGNPLTLPLIHQGATIGQLLIAPRLPDTSFSPADWRLLQGIARQAGVAAYGVRLTADLQCSREQLVTAREEERRRLQRDLHDGLGPSLASLTLKLDTARNLLAHDPAAVSALLTELKAQTQAIVVDVRRLVYDLRPLALDQLGLVSAIREYAASLSASSELQVSIEAPEHLPSLPAAVEVVVYRIVQEALTNVVHHAQARTCVIRFLLDDTLLYLEIRDDGHGLPPNYKPDMGMHSMRERAAELGGACVIASQPNGGTLVWARLPLKSPTFPWVDWQQMKLESLKEMQ
jgi:signal transduction histidine kinase